jgi:hypothetical protein
VRKALNDLTFDSVQPPVDISPPRSFKSDYKKKSAIFNRVKIKSHLCKVCDIINNKNVFVYLMIDNLNDLFPGKTAPLTYLVINYYLNRL